MAMAKKRAVIAPNRFAIRRPEDKSSLIVLLHHAHPTIKHLAMAHISQAPNGAFLSIILFIRRLQGGSGVGIPLTQAIHSHGQYNNDADYYVLHVVRNTVMHAAIAQHRHNKRAND